MKLSANRSKMTPKRSFAKTHAKELKIRVLVFAVVKETLRLYALRSEKKPIFRHHALRFQNQGLELAQILKRSLKAFTSKPILH